MFFRFYSTSSLPKNDYFFRYFISSVSRFAVAGYFFFVTRVLVNLVVFYVTLNVQVWISTALEQNVTSRLFIISPVPQEYQGSDRFRMAEAVTFLLPWRDWWMCCVHHWCWLFLSKWILGLYRQTCHHAFDWQVSMLSSFPRDILFICSTAAVSRWFFSCGTHEFFIFSEEARRGFDSFVSKH